MQNEHAADSPELRHFSSAGVDIAFIDAKPQERDLGEPILLIHGFASNHRINWVNPRWVDTLTKAGRRVVAFDNRGHGQSEKLYAPADYHADLMTRDAVNLLAHLGIERADLMGYSMGARTASFLALAEPNLVRSLILGGLGDRLVRDGGLPETIAAALGGAVAREPYRPDATPVPRLRGPDEERPRCACRVRSGFAPQPNASRGGAHCSADAGRGRRAGYACGRPFEACRPVAARGGARYSWPRSQSRRRRQGVQGRGA
jgi:pimeloyl-ACP methyl ester carboxylesterase